jgi:predicted SAM-dependent methyltransferase
LILSHLKLIFKRRITDYNKVQKLVSFFIRNQKLQLFFLPSDKPKFLNIGCGDNHKKEFINIDYNWRPGINLCWNINYSLPIKPDSMEGVFSEHCMEHLSYDEAQRALSDFFRVLKPGGVVRISVPDAELYLETYHKQKHGEEAQFPYERFAAERSLDTPMMHVNGTFRFHGHQYAYDFETMAKQLQTAGFESIERMSFHKGNLKELLIDEPWRECESLYIEAKKPI